MPVLVTTLNGHGGHWADTNSDSIGAQNISKAVDSFSVHESHHCDKSSSFMFPDSKAEDWSARNNL